MPRDVARIVALYAAERRGLSVPALAASIADENACAVVVDDLATGSLLGFGKTHHWPAEHGAAPAGLYLGGSLVRADARRLGIGRQLVTARLSWAAARGLLPLHSVCAEDNAASCAMHRGAGFVEVLREPGLRGIVSGARSGILWRWDGA